MNEKEINLTPMAAKETQPHEQQNAIEQENQKNQNMVNPSNTNQVSNIVVSQLETHYIGPLPSPLHLEQYARIYPKAIDILFDEYKVEALHRRNLEEKTNNAQIDAAQKESEIEQQRLENQKILAEKNADAQIAAAQKDFEISQQRLEIIKYKEQAIHKEKMHGLWMGFATVFTTVFVTGGLIFMGASAWMMGGIFVPLSTVLGVFVWRHQKAPTNAASMGASDADNASKLSADKPTEPR